MKERVFRHPEFGKLRVYEKDGQIFFNLEDVSRALGYESVDEALKYVDEEDIEVFRIQNPTN